MIRALLVCSICVSIAVLSPAPVGAQTQAENVAAARALGIQGVQLADEGKCAEAVGPLERAEALYHAPSILGRLGECQVLLGQLVLGTENLNRTVREQLAPNAPQAFRDAQARAQKVLDAALPRIARLMIRVEPATAAGLRVTVGTTEVPAALLGAERPTDPGTHQVTAIAPGFLTVQSNVTLAEGAREEVVLRLVPDPNAAPASPAVAPVAPVPSPPPAPAPRVSTGTKSSTAGWVLIGIGAAGVVAGGVTGLLAMNKEQDLDCPNHRCPPPEYDKVEDARALALVSTIGFGVGIAGVAVGTIVLLASGGQEAAPRSAMHEPRARPFLRGQTIGIEGSF
jgi:hypothetical protein